MPTPTHTAPPPLPSAKVRLDEAISRLDKARDAWVSAGKDPRTTREEHEAATAAYDSAHEEMVQARDNAKVGAPWPEKE